MLLVCLAIALAAAFVHIAAARKKIESWEQIARILNIRRVEDLPDGDYEHASWMRHIDRLELHFVRRHIEGADEQESFYCLYDSTHMPPQFTMDGGKISPTWGQELSDAEQHLYRAQVEQFKK